MANVTFYLKKRKNGSDPQIFLNFNYKGKRLRYFTGEKIKEKYWNKNKQLVKSSNPYHLEVNLMLNKLAEKVQKTYLNLLNTHTPATNRPANTAKNPAYT